MNEFMKIAVDEARKGISSGDGGPFGSVVVKDGIVVGRGHNEVIRQNDSTCHGEMMAIRDAILWANITKVYYGCTTDDVDEIGFRDKDFYEKNDDAAEELDREECRRLFYDYLRIEDRKNY